TGGNAPDLARLPTALLPVFLPTLEPVDGYVEDIEAVKAGFIPAMMAYAWFRGRVIKLTGQLEEASTDLLAILDSQGDG
ncbi:MAG TPA: hypothetical protein PKX16_06890, partial [Kiritimatiellia bacterium]|nr:hypothetical protein [Kiritimatiellia bacterium]